MAAGKAYSPVEDAIILKTAKQGKVAHETIVELGKQGFVRTRSSVQNRRRKLLGNHGKRAPRWLRDDAKWDVRMALETPPRYRWGAI